MHPFILSALALAGIRPDPVVLDENMLVGPFVFSGVITDNATTAADLTLGEGTSGAPLRSEDFDTQFPSSNGVKPEALMFIDAVSMDIGPGTDENGITAANLAALLGPGGARLHWARGSVERNYEIGHFANIMVGQSISDTDTTTTDARLIPRNERRVLTIPTGHLVIDLERDTFDIEVGAAVNFVGTFNVPFHLYFEGVVVKKTAIPGGWVPGAACNKVSEASAVKRAERQRAKQNGQALLQIPRR